MSTESELIHYALFLGPPNSGKTTLYNWVTGSKFKTINYPGATVDYSVGKSLDLYNKKLTVIDTPGIYSLSPKTPEEEVTKRLISDTQRFKGPKALVVVVDSTQFTRQILLADQIQELGIKVTIALTMSDVLKNEGLAFDHEKFETLTGIQSVGIDGRLGGNVDQLLNQITNFQDNFNTLKTSTEWDQDKFDRRFNYYKKIEKEVFFKKPLSTTEKNISSAAITDRLDSVLLHPYIGLIAFFIIMFGIFSSVFWLATPAIDFVDDQFSTLIDVVVNLFPGSLIGDFLGNGLIAGVGAFAVFVPQIAILFLGLCLLEDTGYLARASSLIDKPLNKVGLNGRSFVPILSSFACAVPGMMAARTIPNKKERLLTLFILPLMTCSARLPVYALLLAFLFKDQPAWVGGAALAGLYFASLLLGGFTAAFINRLLPPTKDSFFLLELPSYRTPSLRKVLRTVLDKTLSFINRAAPVIFVLSLVIWASSTFPNYDLEDDSLKFKTSYAAQVGQFMEPVFEPMGVDWRVGLGLLSSFAAREVFVSTLAIIFNISEDDEDIATQKLTEKMNSTQFMDGHPRAGQLIFTPSVVVGLIVFFMIALQCMATVGVAKKEFGGWKWPIIQLVAFNLVAYIFAVAIVQLS